MAAAFAARAWSGRCWGAMERCDDPFQPPTCRSGGGNGRCGGRRRLERGRPLHHSAAAALPPIQRRDRRARGRSARFCGPGSWRCRAADLPSGSRVGRFRKRRKQSEIDVHRLERRRPGVDRLDMAAGDVTEQGAVRGGRRRGASASRRAARRRQSDRRCRPMAADFDVAFAAGDLAGKTPALLAFSRKVSSSSFGELRKVLRCSPPRRREFGILAGPEWCGTRAPDRRV